jgi:hypothetical protein
MNQGQRGAGRKEQMGEGREEERGERGEKELSLLPSE